MRQTLHIFRKDVRQFRYLIFLVLAWMAVFVWVAGRAESAVAVVYPPRAFLSFSGYGMPILWAALVGLVLQAEALPGDRQFWLTRPYSRRSLFGAKVLFVLVTVSLPLLVTHAAIVVLAGLPLSAYMGGLLWDQLLVLVMLLMPMMVMGALTRSLVQVIPVGAVVAIAAVVMPSVPTAPLAWIPLTLATAVAALLAAGVLALAYARRRMAAPRLLAIAGVCATIGIVTFMPWQTVAAIQQHVTAPLPQVTVVLASPTPHIAAGGATARGLQFTLNVRGLPEGARLTCEANTIDIHTANGRTFHSEFVLSNAIPWVAEGTCPIGIPVPGDFLDEAARGPVRIHASLYTSVFDAARGSVVSIGEPRRFVPGLGFCAATTSQDGTHVDCRTAFHGHRVDADPHGSFEPYIPGLSYSPFPADLRIWPVEDRFFYFSAYNEQPTITTRAPIAHLKLQVDVPDVHLADYEFGR